MSWFSRKSPQQKQVDAAIKIATNQYLRTIPGGADDIPMQFGLPDSRYRYLLFCLSATITACAPEMKDPDAVANDCLRALTLIAATEHVKDFFDGPVSLQDVANNGAAYLEAFLSDWSRYVDLDREGGASEAGALICSMIHSTESTEPVGTADEERLKILVFHTSMRLSLMQTSFVTLAK